MVHWLVFSSSLLDLVCLDVGVALPAYPGTVTAFRPLWHANELERANWSAPKQKVRTNILSVCSSHPCRWLFRVSKRRFQSSILSGKSGLTTICAYKKNLSFLCTRAISQHLACQSGCAYSTLLWIKNRCHDADGNGL
jgi:hypothetical protein